MSLVTFLGAAGSFARIQEFLGSDERIDTRVFDKSPPPANGEDGEAIILKNTDIGWEPTSDKPAQLREINLRLPRHKLSMIIGPVGCGKTTLVQTLLGEIPALAGSVQFSGCPSAAYCAQNAWHMNGTIRQAIIGTESFDSRWYDRVVDACALKQDFRELPAGDSSRIGSGGIALSGGQSQRIVCHSLLSFLSPDRKLILWVYSGTGTGCLCEKGDRCARRRSQWPRHDN